MSERVPPQEDSHKSVLEVPAGIDKSAVNVLIERWLMEFSVREGIDRDAKFDTDYDLDYCVKRATAVAIEREGSQIVVTADIEIINDGKVVKITVTWEGPGLEDLDTPTPLEEQSVGMKGVSNPDLDMSHIARFADSASVVSGNVGYQKTLTQHGMKMLRSDPEVEDTLPEGSNRIYFRKFYPDAI